METFEIPEAVPVSRPPDRVTALPRSFQEIGDWMWTIVNKGKTPSSLSAGEELQGLAGTLRAAGKGTNREPLSAELHATAAQYARLLGWEVVAGGE